MSIQVSAPPPISPSQPARAPAARAGSSSSSFDAALNAAEQATGTGRARADVSSAETETDEAPLREGAGQAEEAAGEASQADADASARQDAGASGDNALTPPPEVLTGTRPAPGEVFEVAEASAEVPSAQLEAHGPSLETLLATGRLVAADPSQAAAVTPANSAGLGTAALPAGSSPPAEAPTGSAPGAAAPLASAALGVTANVAVQPPEAGAAASPSPDLPAPEPSGPAAELSSPAARATEVSGARSALPPSTGAAASGFAPGSEAAAGFAPGSAAPSSDFAPGSAAPSSGFAPGSAAPSSGFAPGSAAPAALAAPVPVAPTERSAGPLTPGESFTATLGGLGERLGTASANGAADPSSVAAGTVTGPESALPSSGVAGGASGPEAPGAATLATTGRADLGPQTEAGQTDPGAAGGGSRDGGADPRGGQRGGSEGLGGLPGAAKGDGAHPGVSVLQAEAAALPEAALSDADALQAPVAGIAGSLTANPVTAAARPEVNTTFPAALRELLAELAEPPGEIRFKVEGHRFTAQVLADADGRTEVRLLSPDPVTRHFLEDRHAELRQALDDAGFGGTDVAYGQRHDHDPRDPEQPAPPRPEEDEAALALARRARRMETRQAPIDGARPSRLNLVI
jgi:hypothetical protein